MTQSIPRDHTYYQTPDDKEKGQPHVCRNRKEAIAWIEARRADDGQDIAGP
jgi:hypothetical protein